MDSSLRALAIETSGRLGSVAIAEAGVILAEEDFPQGLRHAAEIIPRIDRLCRQRGWTPADLREVYVSAGPGSFTGLRIGITLAKTLALATEARIVAVPSAKVLVANAPAGAQNAIIVLDAKRDQIFTARFSRSSSGKWIEQEAAHLDDLTAMLRRSARPVHLLGEGIPCHEKFIPPGDASVIVTSAELWRGRAAVVAAEGREMASRGEYSNPDRLTPLYIRRPEAEEKWEDQKLRVKG